MDIARILRRRGQYDPLAFPDSGPDLAALALQRKGAPGAPARAGSCMVKVRCEIFESGRRCRYYAVTSLCDRKGRFFDGADSRPTLGEPAQKSAEHDAEVRFKNHICSR